MTDLFALATEIGEWLLRRRETLAVAESCTGGFICNQLTNVPGASAWFERGGVCYSNRSKIDWLDNQPHSGVEGGGLSDSANSASLRRAPAKPGLDTALPGGGKATTESGYPPEVGGRGSTRRREPEGTLAHIIDTHGAVSAECAEAMAAGIRKTAGTTYGISVTGIAGPDGGTPGKPVGTVFIGFAHPKGVAVSGHHFPQGREAFKVAACAAAFNILQLFLVPRTK